MTRYLVPVALLVAGCALAVGLAEGIVRLVDPHARDHVIPAGLMTIDAVLGWQLHPDTTVTHTTRYFTVTYTTNAWGFRDQPRPIDKSAHRRRTLLYGDSQVFGWGVPQAQRFSDLLEAEHPVLEMWNLAVPGYGLDQQLIAYEQADPSWRADAVAFFVSYSTLDRITAGYLYQKHKPRFVLDPSGALQLIPIPRQATTWTSLLHTVLSPLYLPYFLERRLATNHHVLHPAAEPASTRTTAADRLLDALPRALLERAAQVARARGHQMILLTTLPLLADQALQSFCSQHEIRAVTVTLPEPREAFIHGTEDAHWNPRGHRWIAERIWTQWPARDEDGGATQNAPTS